MSAATDLDVLKDIPEYKTILKGVIKTQIQLLVEQLAQHTEEESIILTASVSDGTLSHLGTSAGKQFLDGHDEIKSQFLGFCLSTRHTISQHSASLSDSKVNDLPSPVKKRTLRSTPSAAKRPRIVQSTVARVTASGDGSDISPSVDRRTSTSEKKRKFVGRKPDPASSRRPIACTSTSDNDVIDSKVKLETASDNQDDEQFDVTEQNTSTPVNLPPSIHFPHTQTAAGDDSDTQENDNDEVDDVDDFPPGDDDVSDSGSVSNIKVEPITEGEFGSEITGAERSENCEQPAGSDWGPDTSTAEGDDSVDQSPNKSAYNCTNLRYNMAYVDGKRSVDKSSDAAEHPIVLCDIHPSKPIRWHCSDHDQLFCDQCRSVTHRACQSVKSISEVAKSIQVKDVLDIEGSLRLMKKRLDNLKKSSMQTTTDIRAKTKQSEAEASKLKTKIVNWADDLEKNMLIDIRRMEKQSLNSASEQYNDCDLLITQVENDVKVAKETKSILDKSDRFIAEYKLSKTLTDMTKSASIIERETPKVDINFIPNPVIIAILNDVGQMGTVGVGRKGPAQYVPSAGGIKRSIGDMKVGSATEVKVKSKDIPGSAFMPDGRLVLADYDNNKLLLLNKDFHRISELQLSSRPFNVAVTSDSDVIVTLPNEKTLQYLSVGVKLRADRRITTDKRCYGVAVCGNDVYVSVCDHDGGNGEVQVLDRSGAVRRRVGVDAGGRGELHSPNYIAVSTGGLLYVADRGTDTVSCYSSVGDVVYRVRDMEVPRGLLAVSGGQLLVCCAASSKVRVLGNDGSRRRELLSSRDGLVKLQSISYRNSDATLIVTMYNYDGPCVLAFKLI